MSQARRRSQRRAVSVVIHDLPHEVMLHICETLTPRETCTMMLGLGKRSVIFRCVSEVAILRGSALGKQIEKREGLKCTEDALKYILGRPVEGKDHKSLCKENACAWLALPAPMCSALLVAPAGNQIDALRGAAFLGLLPLAQLHARAIEHGASVIKREHSETEKQACKEAAAFCRKALRQSDESQVLRRASVSIVTDAERRFTNVYLQLFQDHELRRHNAESASSANTALFRFIDQHLATATGVRVGPVENMHNSALAGLLAGLVLGNSAKEDDEKQDFLSKVMSRCEKPLSLQRSQRERRFCDLCLQPLEGMYAGCRSCGFDCCPRCVDPASHPTHVCVPLDVATRMYLFVELCQTADGLEDAHPSAIAAQKQLSAAQIDYQAFLAKRAEHDATLLRLAKGGHLHELKIWLDACYGGAAAMGPRMLPEPPCLASHVRDLLGVASLPSSTASSAGPSRLSRS